METRILKPALSLSAIAFAVFAAFAFSTVPQKAEVVDIYGRNPEEDCKITDVLCTDNSANPVCQLEDVDLFEMNSATSCTKPLYRKQ